jgi:hypothetical protein
MFYEAPLTFGTHFVTFNSCQTKNNILYRYVHLYVQSASFVLKKTEHVT